MNNLKFIGCNTLYKESNIVIYGAPFDGTVSFKPGSRFAPNIIRLDSEAIETYSPYLDIDIENKKISDIGDIELPFGNTNKTLDLIYNKAKSIINDNKKPFLIGGEHLVTYPQLKAIQEVYEDIHILHLDAHTDLRDTYLNEKLSHATVMKRCFDIVGKNRIYQFGIRSGTKKEFIFSNENCYIEKYTVNTIKDKLEELKDKPIYLTIDLDVLDPSIFSGTGTPEPGGITYKELIDFIISIKDLNIVGADVVELAPKIDTSGVSTIVACKTIREILGIL